MYKCILCIRRLHLCTDVYVLCYTGVLVCSFFAGVVRLDFEWKKVNNIVDCRVFVMRHLKTWFGITTDKWDNGFPLGHKEKKACLTRLRKRYAIKLVTSEATKHRSRVLAEAAKHEKANEIGVF
ncbi:hypothetical protein Hanom_Chr11g01034941 [Helianthus anomalus]